MSNTETAVTETAVTASAASAGTAPTEWVGPPRFLPPPAPTERSDGSRHFAGVTYAAPPGYRPLQLDVWVPASSVPAPLVVWIHGGAWMIGDRRSLPETLRPNQLFEALLDAGLAVATIDYRFAKEATFPAQLHDAKAAVRYLRAHSEALGVDTEKIGVWGESAGGHLAALVALTGHRPDLEGDLGVVGPSSSVDVVVDWYGVSDADTMPKMSPPPEIAAVLPPDLLAEPLDVLLAGADAATRRDVSPVNHVTAQAPAFLLVHGTADFLVPYAQSEKLASALSAVAVAVELVPVPGADHIFLKCQDVDSIVRMSVDYLSNALRERS